MHYMRFIRFSGGLSKVIRQLAVGWRELCVVYNTLKLTEQ